MKAIRIYETGSPEVLKIEELQLPDPQQGEVRIRHTAIGFNFQDIYTRSGQYAAPLPTGLGTEAVGIVEALGPDVTDFKVGDRVCYASGPVLAACATHRNYPAARLLHAPAHMKDEEIAASLLKGMTVEYLMERCYPVQKGQYVLMHAAAGGVGLLAGQWGRHLGARMIGVAAGEEKVKLALANGYEHCLDRLKDDIPARVKEITGGKGLKVVYDSVGKDTWEGSLACLAPFGLMASFGNASGPVDPISPGILGPKGSLYLTRQTLFTHISSREATQAMVDDLFSVVSSGAVQIKIEQRYALKDVAQAHRDLEARKTTGCTILTV